MTSDDALLELAALSSEAVAEVLRTFLPDGVEVGEPEVVEADMSPLDGVVVPAVAADASYSDGSSGGNLFLTTVVGARRLAAAVMGTEPHLGGQPLDEREQAAMLEAMEQVMVAAAAATSKAVEHDVALSAPRLSDVETVLDAVALAEGAQHATRVTLTIAGEPCRLAQLVPKAFMLKLTRAPQDEATEFDEERDEADGEEQATDEILRGVHLRVCAEIGRTTMVTSQAVGLPRGGIIELDSGADEAVDVLVNGLRFATGRLVLVEGEWAVRIEEVLVDVEELRESTVTAAVERA